MTGQPVLNPRKEKRERKAVTGGREKMTKRESEREKWGWGERKRGGLPLLSAKKSRSNHRECCRKEKKVSRLGVRSGSPQKLPGTEEFWLSKPTSPFKVDRL